MACGIYRITNKINGVVYIGQSEKISERWHRHIRNLEAGRHDSEEMQDDWNKYGPTAFAFEVVTVCPKQRLDNEEIAEIERFSGELYNTMHAVRLSKKRQISVKTLSRAAQKKEDALQWLSQHPDATPTVAASELGVSRQTVYNYKNELQNGNHRNGSV